MNTDQADAIENLMAQGFTRVQAIKIFYEQSLAKFYTKQYHNDDTDLFDQVAFRISPFEYQNLNSFLLDWTCENQR